MKIIHLGTLRLVSPEAAAVARANGDFIALAVRDGRLLSYDCTEA
jgi:hypothetical protein